MKGRPSVLTLNVTLVFKRKKNTMFVSIAKYGIGGTQIWIKYNTLIPTALWPELNMQGMLLWTMIPKRLKMLKGSAVVFQAWSRTLRQRRIQFNLLHHQRHILHMMSINHLFSLFLLPHQQSHLHHHCVWLLLLVPQHLFHYKWIWRRERQILLVKIQRSTKQQ